MKPFNPVDPDTAGWRWLSWLLRCVGLFNFIMVAEIWVHDGLNGGSMTVMFVLSVSGLLLLFHDRL